MRRWLAALFALILLACNGDNPAAGDGDARSGGDSATAGDVGGDLDLGDDAGSGDAPIAVPQLILDLRNGVRDAIGTVRYGAQNGGWPRAVPGGFLFVRLDDGGGPYQLAGDHEGWTGAAMALEDGLYWAVAALSTPLESKYKFIDGGSTFDADPWARRYNFDGFGEYSLVESAAAHLERFLEVGDGVLSARTLRVWVPAGTVTHQIYVHDGQNLFHPNAMGGGWRLQESLAATTMAIGIDNTPDRFNEYTHVTDDITGSAIGGNGDAYSDFVLNTVRTLIEAEYGAAPTVGVMGSSLGGLIAFHQVHRNPSAWDFGAAMSGTFGWGSMGTTTNETLIERFANTAFLDVPLYLDSGGNDGGGCIDSDSDGIEDDSDGRDNYCVTQQLAAILAAGGWTWDADLWHWWEPDAPHNEAAWAARVGRPLATFEAL